MRSDSEETLRRVLAGLGDAEVPGGMERRVLAAVRERAAEPRRRWAWPKAYPAQSRLVRGWATEGVFAGALAICLVLLVVHRPERVPRHVAGPRAALGRQAERPPSPPTAPVALRAVGVNERIGVCRAKLAGAGDGGELDAAWAPSHPAPPMPLTEQERLLVRLTHKGDPVELAMLDPMLREARNAEEKAAFQSFFERPVTGDSK